MVGCKIRSRKRKSEAEEWISRLLRSKFFGACVDHGEFRKNEKNLFCIDCNLCLCKHCVISSSPPPLHRCFHRLLQICKYVYRDVVRLHDIQPYLDCSLIQAYKINGEKAVHLNPRPQQKDVAKSSKTKGGGTCCEACGRHIQDLPNRFCSIACKMQVSVEMTIIKRSGHKIIGTSGWSSDGEIPSLETEENSYSYENGYASLTEESSEVIQTWWRRPLPLPLPMPLPLRLHKRKSLPKRSPLS